MFFEKNAAALCKTEVNKPTVNYLRNIEPADDLEIYETEDGSLTVKYKSVFLHDIYGAVAEAKKLCDDFSQSGIRSFHIVIGLGLGYLLRELRTRSKGKILIYEPNMRLLRYVLDNVDLSTYLETSNVFLTIERKQFALQLQSLYTFGEKFELLIPMGYIELMGDEINSMLKDEITTIVKNERNGSGIAMLFQDEWNKHFIQNIPHLAKAHVLPEIKDRYSNRPVLLVSAGPSLDDAIPMIKQIADRVLIISIGQALRILQSHGIQPDFVTLLDYEGPLEQLRDLPMKTDDISFILGPFAHSIGFEMPARHYFTVLTENYAEFTRWYDETFKTSTDRFTSGSSVSLLSLQSAFLLGCSTIILVGQDLAFRGKQIYAGSSREANITEDGFLVRDDIESVKNYRFRLLDVKGQHGETLKTSPDYAWFIDQFNLTGKSMKEARPELRLINASVGGVYLEQYEHFSLQELEKQGLFTPFDKTPVLLPDQERTSEDISHRVMLVKKALENMLGKIDETIKYAQHGQELAQLMLHSDQGKWMNQHKQVTYYRRELSKRLNSDPLITYFLLSDVLLLYRTYQTEVNGIDDILKNIKLDMMYFDSIAKRMKEKFKPWIQASLERVNALLPEQVSC